ncbi:ABC transporter ATP-binding protein [Roseimaritima sediminicola]|uniref:ABC transporter ATP-binding protein n=1 Tax=Roseimaritima sediminicola TaxID=2662066 RepID=UPI00192A26EB|nr:ATP-binding cassette domain-containing protein [Roseimaritima sediminicola]
MSHSPPLLELEQVTVTRGPVRILDRVDITLPQGQHTAILGANGSGKTSLLKLLIRQFYPSVDGEHAGTVRILGRSDWHIDSLRRQLGIVSNELDQAFASGRSGRMTALQTVLSGFSGVRLARHLKYDGKRDVRRAGEALERMDAGHLAERTLETMSTGERRRTLIARALVHGPAALVLDEPTTGLDIAARATLLKQLGELAAGGTTLLLVTHHVEEILPAIRRVVLLKAGRVHGVGETEQMLTDDRLSDVFETPVAVGRHDQHWTLRVEREGATGRR